MDIRLMGSRDLTKTRTRFAYFCAIYNAVFLYNDATKNSISTRFSSKVQA